MLFRPHSNVPLCTDETLKVIGDFQNIFTNKVSKKTEKSGHYHKLNEILDQNKQVYKHKNTE